MNQLIKAAAAWSMTSHTDGKSIQPESTNHLTGGNSWKDHFISRARRNRREEKNKLSIVFDKKEPALGCVVLGFGSRRQKVEEGFAEDRDAGVETE